MNALRPGTFEGPAPVSGTWHQPFSIQEQVRQQPLHAVHPLSALTMARAPYQGPQDPAFVGTVSTPAPVLGTWQQPFPDQQQVRPPRKPTQQPPYAAHQQSPLIMAPDPYQPSSGAGFSGTVGDSASMVGMMHQPDPWQGQVPPLQGMVQQLHMVHQQPLMMPRGPYQDPPDAGYAGAVGDPAPLFGMMHQFHPRQGQLSPPQGAAHQPPVVQQQLPPGMAPGPYWELPCAGYAGTVGDPDTVLGMMHQPDPRQRQRRPPEQLFVAPPQPLSMAGGPYQGAGWDWSAEGQVAGTQALEPNEFSREARAHWAGWC